MSFEPEHDSVFQYATFATLALTLVLCACYALVFLNPFVNPVVALRPFTATLRAVEYPATYTPTLTPTPTDSPTVTWTPVPVITLTPIPSVTDTPVPTTPRPLFPSATPRVVTIIRTATPHVIIVTRTATRTPTRIRTATQTATPTSVLPTSTSVSPYSYDVAKQGCFHSGQTFVEGTVYENAAGSAVVNNARVRLASSPGGPAIAEDTSGSHGRAGYYVLFINTNGPLAGTWFVWVVGVNGAPASNPADSQFQTNTLGAGNASSCWRQVVDFVKR